MRAFVWAFAAACAATAAFVACGDAQPYKTPASDKNFDDPDDPGSSGGGDPFGKKDASGDAAGRFCVADRDCPAAFRCTYPVASGCSASGTCQGFDSTKCVETTACGCNNVTLEYCLVPGSAPAAVSALGACDGGVVVIDAGADATETDASGE